MEQVALIVGYGVFLIWSVGFTISLIAALLNLCGINLSLSPLVKAWHSMTDVFSRIHLHKQVENHVEQSVRATVK